MRRVPFFVSLPGLLVAALLAVIAVYGCHAQSPGPSGPRLISFETASDLAFWRPDKGARAELSPLHATDGHRSLRLVLSHAEYPGLSATRAVLQGWEAYDTFRLEIFNPRAAAFSLNVRIDDEASHSYATRYNEVFPLRPGANEIAVPLRELRVSDGSRQLDPARLREVMLFLSSPPEGTTLFLDQFRVEREAPAEPPGAGGRYRFDFGTPHSPVWPGFTRVSPATAADGGDGSPPANFGWAAETGADGSSPLAAGDLGTPDALAGDYVTPGDRPFVVRLEPGSYEAAVLASGRGGDGLATHSLTIEVNGRPVARVGVGPVLFYSSRGYYLGIDDDPTDPRGDAWERFVEPNFLWRRFRFEARDPGTRFRFRGCRVYALILARVARSDGPAERREDVAAASGRAVSATPSGDLDGELAALDVARRKEFFDRHFALLPAPAAVPASYTAQENERGYAVYAVSPDEPITPETRPPLRRVGPMETLAAPGERVHVAFALTALRPLRDVRVRLGEGPAGASVRALPAGWIEVRCARYQLRSEARGIFRVRAERLTPAAPVSLRAGISKAWWLTLQVPMDASPGRYQREVLLQPEGRPPTRMLVQLEVLPIRLDDPPDRSFGWYYYPPATMHGRSAFAGQQERARRLLVAELEDQRRHGSSAVQLPAPSLVRLAPSGVPVLDFTALADFPPAMRAARIGLDRPNQSFVINLANALERLDLRPFSPEYERAYKAALGQARDWAAREKLPLLFWLVDEPRESAATRFAGARPWNRNGADTLRLLRLARQVPGVRTTVSPMADRGEGQDYTPMASLADVTQTHAWPGSRRLIERARREHALWVYNNGANRLSYGFALWKLGARGRWQWHYQDWVGQPYNPVDADDGSRTETGAVYPSPEGPVATVAYEWTAMGTWDFRVVTTLSREAAVARDPARRSAAQAANRLLAEIRRTLPEFPDSGLGEGTESGSATTTVLPLERWRRDAERLLVVLQNRTGGSGRRSEWRENAKTRNERKRETNGRRPLTAGVCALPVSALPSLSPFAFSPVSRFRVLSPEPVALSGTRVRIDRARGRGGDR